VGFNLLLWLTMPGVYWMWWNLSGFLIAAGVSYFLALMDRPPRPDDISPYVLRKADLFEEERRWFPAYAILIMYFLLILTILLLI
jgi:sodium-coupled monocarboxylate transporter 8/12